MIPNITIVSRNSKLALWQANFVKTALETLYPQLRVSILGVQTEGDVRLESSLAKIGGKGLFVKALEDCLLNGTADIAVHSLKDMPSELPTTLTITAILQREDPREAFISNTYKTIRDLPPNACIGTSSLRRQSQLLSIRKDLLCRDLRGNVDTRLQKLDNGECTAIILAVAGLKRLGLEHRIADYLSTDVLLPAVGQGALAIECRAQDRDTQALLRPLHHVPTATCVLAERRMNALLGGGCQFPIAAYATLTRTTLELQGMVNNPNGKQCLKARAASTPHKPLDVGKAVADMLFAMGAEAIIRACGNG